MKWDLCIHIKGSVEPSTLPRNPLPVPTPHAHPGGLHALFSPQTSSGSSVLLCGHLTSCFLEQAPTRSLQPPCTWAMGCGADDELAVTSWALDPFSLLLPLPGFLSLPDNSKQHSNMLYYLQT